MIDKAIYYGEDGVVGVALTTISMHVLARMSVMSWPSPTFGVAIPPETTHLLCVLFTSIAVLFVLLLCALDILIYRAQIGKQLAYCMVGIMVMGFSHYILLGSSPYSDQLLQACAGVALIPCLALLCVLGTWMWKHESVLDE